MVLAGSPVLTAAPYVEDVEFLLREFEAKAGALMKVKGIDWPAVASAV